MNQYIFWGISTVVMIAVGVIAFFLKRTLDDVVKTNDKNAEHMQKVEDDFKNYKVDNKVEFQNTINLFIDKLDALKKDVTSQIDSIEEKNIGKINKLEDSLKEIADKFYDFKEQVAKTYTKNEDFSSYTRDLDQKLDRISSGVNKISGILEGEKNAINRCNYKADI